MRQTVPILILLILSLAVSVVSPAVTYADTTPKIKHLIFIVQENHSFDNYFGTYPGANGLPLGIQIPLNISDLRLGYVSPFHLNVKHQSQLSAMSCLQESASFAVESDNAHRFR